MDVMSAEPAELTFWGLPVRVTDMLPPESLMVVTPMYDRFGHLDYAATVNSSIMFENVGSA
jgi:hypothetical protein